MSQHARNNPDQPPMHEALSGAQFSSTHKMPPGRNGIPPNHPRRIAHIAHAPAGWLARETPEVQRLCAEYRTEEAERLKAWQAANGGEKRR